MTSEEEKNPVRNDGSQGEPVSNGTGKSETALRPTNAKSAMAGREERVLEFWKENKIFEKSLEKSAPKGHYVFYDGPPFATGLMHVGHVLGSTAKDVIGRYQTMQGFYVPRKWGWDCHGLPIENIVEKDLGVSGHKEIEALGIERFVEYARSKVLTYDHEWKKSVERMGRWVDFDGGYKTMDNTFIESVWWALSELNKKDLIYEGIKVLAYCSRCETPIAKSEIAMDDSYKDISDISVYVKFKLENEPNTYLLAWTTTPWSLPGDVAVAVNSEAVYVKVVIEGIYYILAKDRVVAVLKDKKFEIVEEFKGSELIGKKYIPPFDYYTHNKEISRNPKSWTVLSGSFVTTFDGTGLAHEAPAFGEDDMELAKKENLPWIIHVDSSGKFKKEVTDFAGLSVKPKSSEKDGHQSSDIEIIKYLAKKNLLFAKEKIIHPYPHCMRCDTPIIYYALPSWFINIAKVKEDIMKKAETMDWIPAHLKEGRFKNIVESAPDWNISRNRYWASPLPIWKCSKCENKKFISSLADLKEKTKKSGNKYFVMRHGEAIDNAKHIDDPKGDPNNHLTDLGEQEVVATSKRLKNKKINLILSSPFLRTQETAEIVRRELGLESKQVVVDNRLHEYNEGDQNLVAKRMGDFLYDVENKYKDKNIIIISHGNPIWTLQTIVSGIPHANFTERQILNTGEEKEFTFIPLPHNANYELDYHRPYIDEIKFICECGGEMNRISEVLDCWFESGSMPFAQDHFPFENLNWQKNNFPAGFVAEYIAQTRTWFYYTHVVSTILFNHAPFNHVVTTGTLRAEDGQKMSKSKGNYPDTLTLFDKYGVDALRLYLMSSPLMKGEDANFSEQSVQEISNKIIGRLFNVFAFYELYPAPEQARLSDGQARYGASRDKLESQHILDQWILSRLNQVIQEVTTGMEAYDMVLATRPLDGFVEDLSTWYLRRSRERIKSGDHDAKQTLYFVLKTLAKLMAPFAPFTAEDIWLKLKTKDDVESVHLESWPGVSKFDKDLLNQMQIVRDYVTAGHMLRQKSNIPVRQPLAEFFVPIIPPEEYKNILKNELNVKKITKGENTMYFDLNITPELKQEGNYRELVRAIQDMRKKMELTPNDKVSLLIETDEEGKKIIQKFEVDMKKTVLASQIEFGKNDEPEIKIDELVFKIKIEK